MYENKFLPWKQWACREGFANLDYPGVYVLAYSLRNIAGTPFSWRKAIIYVGMTNSVSGLKGRLKQFDNTIQGKTGHGGADRVRFKHRDYNKLTPNLYVAVAPFKCDPESKRPDDLRKMGEVAKFEYSCFAQFAEKFGDLPEFNKRSSLKHSKTIGRGIHG
jgi:hypothetical protein